MAVIITLYNYYVNGIIEAMQPDRPNRRFATAFLLAQVGAHAARQFAERLTPLGVTPAHAGILRRLAASSGISQRELASRLGMHASRLVAVVDEMESMGLIVRESHAEDRRAHALQITPQGREKLATIGAASRQHNDTLCAALNEEERGMLAELLQRIADQQGLTPGVHPGYSRLGEKAQEAGGKPNTIPGRHSEGC
jgi:DNA-binding MarR family transcriptional regulator